MTVVLVVPEQPRFQVAEQRSFSCEACAAHFIETAGMGYTISADQHDCELHYDGVCIEQR